MQSLIKTLLPLGLALSAVGAQAADSLNIAYQHTQGVSLWTSETGDYQTGAMQYVLQGGGSFEAFCIEIAEDPFTPQLFTQYTVGSFSGTPTLQRQGDLLQGLFSSSYASLDSDLKRAAFQVAVWEITHETSNQLDVAYLSGSFYFQDFSSPSTESELLAFEGLANGFLQAAAAYQGPSLFKLSRLSSDGWQDLVTATPVPEPSSYALMLAGLGVVGWAKRRRRG